MQAGWRASCPVPGMLPVCWKQRTACFSLSLGPCQKASPGLTLCPGPGEGRNRQRQQRVSLRRDGTEHLQLSRGQRSPLGNRVQPGLERSQEGGQNPARSCCLASVPMRNNGSPCRGGWEPGLSSELPLAGVGCSEALAAQHVTKSLLGQREESLPSEARAVVGLFRKLVSSSQAGRGVTCSIAELWPTRACLWLLVQPLGTSLLAVWLTLSHGVSLPCLHVIIDSADPGRSVAF